MNLYSKSIFKIKTLFFVFLFPICLLFSQKQKTKEELFFNEIEKKATTHKSDEYFFKAASFFTKKNWDSTLVYTMKHLNSSKYNKDLTDYSHYFRGYSFQKKKLFKEAQKEFELTSPEFDYQYLVEMGLGEIALEQSEFEKAVSYFYTLIELPTNNSPYLKREDVFYNLGLCFHHLNRFKEAEPYLIESVKLHEEQKDTLEMIKSYGNVANLYYEQYLDDLAISYFEKAYQLSKKIKDFDSKQWSAFNMAIIEENRKDFKKALAYRKEYETWNDSLNDQNKIYQVAQLEKQFAIKEKQKEVSILLAENKAKIVERNGLLYSALILVVMLLTIAYFYSQKIKTNKIILAQKESLDELNATKDKLFSIVSHDLRSSVNALKSSNTKLLDNLEAKNLNALDNLLHKNSSIVNGAYNLLDNLLHWALLQTKQSYFEIAPIRLFFIVEQMVYNYKPLMLDKNIHFENNILKSDLVLADQESLKIILRNLLDNAIKFTKSDGVIKVYTQHQKEGFCNLIIEDSGIGMSESTRLKLLKDSELLPKKEHENIIGTGLGLQLCKSMIKKNNGTLSIESDLKKGTKMIVSLPQTT